MSTTKYLETLEYSQLKYARKEADRLMEAIEDQEKITLWIVTNGGCNEACYHEHEWETAKTKLCEMIMKEGFEASDYRSFCPEITKRVVPESEVKAWMEINT